MKNIHQLWKNGLAFLMWETDPRKRNINNEIQLNSVDPIEVGQYIYTKIDNKTGGTEWRKVLEILNVKDSNIEGKKHYTIKAEYGKTTHSTK